MRQCKYRGLCKKQSNETPERTAQAPAGGLLGTVTRRLVALHVPSSTSELRTMPETALLSNSAHSERTSWRPEHFSTQDFCINLITDEPRPLMASATGLCEPSATNRVQEVERRGSIHATRLILCMPRWNPHNPGENADPDRDDGSATWDGSGSPKWRSG